MILIYLVSAAAFILLFRLFGAWMLRINDIIANQQKQIENDSKRWSKFEAWMDRNNKS